jgi:hypothetical protein
MVRRNLAYSQLLTLPVTLAPVVFGLISDTYGLRLSIELAALVLVATILLVQLALPRRPRIIPSNDNYSEVSPEKGDEENGRRW